MGPSCRVLRAGIPLKVGLNLIIPNPEKAQDTSLERAYRTRIVAFVDEIRKRKKGQRKSPNRDMTILGNVAYLFIFLCRGLFGMV
jgi:hypothetical protein